MANEFINNSLKVISVPVTLFILSLPFSFLTGWNLTTAIIFWFLITPFVAEYLPTIFSKDKNQLAHSLIGILVFYSFMILMIYDHYKSDLFSIMMASCAINLIIITVISRVKRVYREPSY